MSICNGGSFFGWSSDSAWYYYKITLKRLNFVIRFVPNHAVIPNQWQLFKFDGPNAMYHQLVSSTSNSQIYSPYLISFSCFFIFEREETVGVAHRWWVIKSNIHWWWVSHPTVLIMCACIYYLLRFKGEEEFFLLLLFLITQWDSITSYKRENITEL